jgi:hypothetical protein
MTSVGARLPVAVPSSASFSVALKFFVDELGPTSADLDNLAKPVLDTLFEPRPNPNAPVEISGAVFKAHDALITELTLRKQHVANPTDLGVRIVVSWTD